MNHKNLNPADFLGRTARDYIRRRVLDSDAGIREGEYDMFGAELETVANVYATILFLYEYYFRVQVSGIENLPLDGPGLIVSNHAPILPIDAAMIAMSALVEPERPRFVRTIINRTISSIPFGSTLLSRTGQVIGCDENVQRIFENKNLVLVFPTGAEGDVHTIFDKYKIENFTIGFMEYALRYSTPIIPACVTGSEEAAMTLGKIDVNFAGFKHLPLTPIFPWLGIAGLIPFPSQFHIRFDPPIDYHTDHAGDVDNPAKVRVLVDELRDKIQAMLDEEIGRE